MAAALFKHALNAQAEPFNKIEVISAGISAIGNQPPTGFSITAMKNVGLDISNHQSQNLTQDILDRSFAVFVMTQSHKDLIEMSFSKTPKNLYLMRELIPNVEDIEIPDPFGSSLPVYVACRDNMLDAVPSLIHFVKNNYPIREFTQESKVL